MWPFKKNYMYYKCVTNHYYGLSGSTTLMFRLEVGKSSRDRMEMNQLMGRCDFTVTTKEQYDKWSINND